MASFLFVLLAASGCSPAQQEVLLSGDTMGTTYSVKYVDQGEVDRAAIGTKVAQLLDLLDSSMSTYQEASELNQLNRSPVGQDFPVSSAFWQVLLIAESVFQSSNGAFDPSVGPLVDLWGFGPIEKYDALPTRAEIDALMINIGFQHLKFLPFSQSVNKMTDIRLDLSAIAKGFAAEQVAELLVDLDMHNFLVEIGGELRAAGLNQNGQAWRIAVETPALARGSVQQIVSITNMGVATSGDYRNFFEKDGIRYSHTIDPRTGWPVTHNLASVTVIAQDATEADALATAYTVLGAETALAHANLNNVAAFFLVKTEKGFKELSSDTFIRYLTAQ